jgi:CCR4-NOT complex subunit CAF16
MPVSVFESKTEDAGIASEVSAQSPLHIDVQNLTFAYPGRDPILRNLNMQLTNGARCLLIGANGAGKSSILRILGGRHMTKPDGAVKVLGRSAFHDTMLNFDRSYLDTDWGMRTVAFAVIYSFSFNLLVFKRLFVIFYGQGYGCPLQADIPVRGMMQKLQEEYPERRDLLVKLLGVDLDWRMHQVSDGQRRRVQLLIGLLRPFKILLLDEVTVSLDVVVRQDLLRWLRYESETRGAPILYATHIFDGLDDWPTHLHYLGNRGQTGWQGRIGDLDLYQKLRSIGEPSPLLRIAETWLRAELEQRSGAKEEASGPAAQDEKNPLAVGFTKDGGGYTAGRMAGYDFVK